MPGIGIPGSFRRLLPALLGAVLVLDAAAGAEPLPSPVAPVPAKVYRYARRLVRQYDRDGDGQLQKGEWASMQGQPARIDADRDGAITVEELTQWIAAYGSQRRIRVDWALPLASPDAEAGKDPVAKPEPGAAPADEAQPPAGAASDETPAEAPPREQRFYLSPKRVPAGLPAWFLGRDLDGDGQLIFSEYAPQATSTQQQEFNRYDLNRDGVLTPQEYLKAARPAKGTRTSGQKD